MELTWGHRWFGGDSFTEKVVVEVDPSKFLKSFVTVLKDGTVVTWSISYYRGGSSTVQTELVGVETFYSAEGASALILKVGSVVSWGPSLYGDDSTTAQATFIGVEAFYHK